MSLLPYLLNEILDDYRRPRFGDLYDQHFGLGLLNDDIRSPSRGVMVSVPLRSGYVRPWRNLAAGDSGVSTVSGNTNEFRVNLDVQQFKPEELKVKVADGYIVIDGKHEERSDQHGFISRQFTRRYKIPENVDEAKLSSHLSSDGVLTLTAPINMKEEAQGREIPIVQTNQPAVKQPSAPSQLEEKKQEDKMES